MSPRIESEGARSERFLIGRERELRVLNDLLDGVENRGAALVVRGEAGIGKSTMVRSARDGARARRFQILTTAGVQCETHLPFSGLHQLLQPMLSGVDHLPSPQRRAVEAAFGIAEAPAPELFLIALATLHLLSDAASDEPLLLIVEDAQWLDRPTAEVLTFVSRRLESDPIIVLVAIRDGFESPLDAAGLQELRLGRLDTASSAELLDTRNPGLGPSIRARVLEEAEGNPLALVELPAAMLETDVFGAPISPTRLPLTTRLEAAFSARTDDLPDATGKALLVTAADDQGLLRDVLAANAILVGVNIVTP